MKERKKKEEKKNIIGIGIVMSAPLHRRKILYAYLFYS